MNYRLRLWISALALVACSPKTDLTESASDTPGSSGSSGDNSTSLGNSQTSAPPTSDTLTTGTPTTSDGQTVTTANPSEPGTASATTAISETETDGPGTTTGTGSTSTGSDNSSTGDLCDDPPDQPQSSACTDASGCGCASDRCFIVPLLGGFCGECLADADCPDGGCTVPNFVDGVGSVCNTGKAGDGCGSDAVCNDPSAPHCSVVIGVQGILEVATCGECETDADCPPQTPHCTPDYQIGELTGQLVCRASGSLPNNSGCALNGSGDQACASGFCAEGSIMGVITLGICGECITDNDCGPGQSCSTPTADLDAGTLIGAVCM